MRPLILALLIAAGLGAPAAAQSYLAPGDLDHVLGAALALSMQAADALGGALPTAADDRLTAPDDLRRLQAQVFRAALLADRADTYLRLYVIHLGEHRETAESPSPQWTALFEALEAVPACTEELLGVPAERLDEEPFDAWAARLRLTALAARLRAAAVRMGEEPRPYEGPGRFEDRTPGGGGIRR